MNTTLDAPGRADRVRVVRGAICMVAAAALFTVSGVAVKAVGDALPTVAFVFWRSALGALLLAPLALRRRRRWFRRDNLGLIALRSITVLVALWCYYRSLTLVPLATAVLLISSAPLFVPALGRLFFGFMVNGRAQAATAIGLLGVVVILDPSAGAPAIGALLALAAGVAGAIGAVLVWRMPGGEDAFRVAFLLALYCALGSLPFALLDGRMPSLDQFGWLAVLAACSTGAHALISHACLIAPADRVMPFDYANVLFAGLIGAWLFGELLDARFALGSVLIVAAGTLALRARSNASSVRAGGSR